MKEHKELSLGSKWMGLAQLYKDALFCRVHIHQMQEPSKHTSYQEAEKGNGCKAMHAQSLIDGNIQFKAGQPPSHITGYADSLAMRAGVQSRIYTYTAVSAIQRK